MSKSRPVAAGSGDQAVVAVSGSVAGRKQTLRGSIVAILKVQLWAGGELIAESSDAQLWSRMFEAIQQGDSRGGSGV